MTSRLLDQSFDVTIGRQGAPCNRPAHWRPRCTNPQQIVAQNGKPSAAHVIARSMAEPFSNSKNTKTWAMPIRDPRSNPKPTLLTAEQRKMLDAVPQSRPTSARRTIGFTDERSPIRLCLSLLVIPGGEVLIDGSQSEQLLS
jgi:hypothetical protein